MRDAKSVRAKPPDLKIRSSHVKAMSFMHPSTLRSAVLAKTNVRAPCIGENGRQVLRQDLVLDERSDERTRVPQLADLDVGGEDREQGAGVCE